MQHINPCPVRFTAPSFALSDITTIPRMRELQSCLLRTGQFIPGATLAHPADLARKAKITASSELALGALQPCGETLPLDDSWAIMLPAAAGTMPALEFTLDAAAVTTMRAELRVSSGRNQCLPLDFKTVLDQERYAFVCLMRNENIALHLSDQRLTGIISLCQTGNKAVAKSSVQSPPPGIGIDTFEFWTPKRRPHGKNLAMRISPALQAFNASHLTNGVSRPVRATNAWAADFSDAQPVIRLQWDSPQTIASIEIDFDTDFDHPMESVLMGHPERDMPFCVREVRIQATSTVIAEILDNHQTRSVVRLQTPVTTDCLELHLASPSEHVPAALFAVRCFGPCDQNPAYREAEAAAAPLA